MKTLVRMTVVVTVVVMVGLFLSRGFVVAQPTGVPDVVINEVAWAGTAASTADEWIELFNNTNADIDLSGWTLAAADGSLSIDLAGTIAAQSFFLLERFDDTSVKDIAADQIYNGVLRNGGEALQLRDGSGNLIDSANGDGGAWPAGDSNSSRSSMERICSRVPDTDASWVTNDNITRNGVTANNLPINGTPKAANSQASCQVTAIALISFTASTVGQDIIIAWTTGTELDNAGFNLYRAEVPDGLYTRINASLIPAQGDPLTGGNYAYTDRPGSKRVYYTLEDVDTVGVGTVHGPILGELDAIHDVATRRMYLPILTR